MATPRKTFKVEEFKGRINDLLTTNNYDSVGRLILQDLLIGILFDTENYKGFRYLESKELEDGEIPGIRFHEDGTTPDFHNTDKTRVHYF